MHVSLAPERSRSPLTVALVGGRRLIREATARLLSAREDLHVCASLGSLQELLAARWDQRPAIVLLDCDGCEPSSHEPAMAVLSTSMPTARLVLLCTEINPALMRWTTQNQIDGVILKRYTAAEVHAAIVYVAGGRRVMPIGWQSPSLTVGGEAWGLTRRHREVLELVARGHRNAEIARQLELSPSTVKAHIRSIYQRIGVRNRVEAANRYSQIAGGSASG